MVFYGIFQDNIGGFNMYFPISCCGFYGCLYISYALFLDIVFPIIAAYCDTFRHIIWDLLSWISGSNKFALMFLKLCLVDFSSVYGHTLFYKQGATAFMAQKNQVPELIPIPCSPRVFYQVTGVMKNAALKPLSLPHSTPSPEAGSIFPHSFAKRIPSHPELPGAS